MESQLVETLGITSVADLQNSSCVHHKSNCSCPCDFLAFYLAVVEDF